MSLFDLPLVRVQGSPEAMGQAYGEACAEAIQQFVSQRLRAAKVYLWERGSRDMAAFERLGAECYTCFCQWDAAGAEEHNATAHGAGVDPATLYLASNMTDIRDVLLAKLRQAAPASEAEGCSALVVPAERSASGQLLAAQTWDLNPQDVEDIIAIHRRPHSQPATWSITCNGCPTLMGMNEYGLAVGTTNVKTSDARIGVGYLSLLHRAIRATTVAEAAAIIQQAPRAAAHTYWLADAHEARLLTCSASAVQEERLTPEHGLSQTNHLRNPPAGAEELEPAHSSSEARLCRLQDWLSRETQVRPVALRDLFADRSDGIDSINRYPEDRTGTATDACMITCPATRTLWACRGPADRGRWYRLDIASGEAHDDHDLTANDGARKS